MLTADVAENEN